MPFKEDQPTFESRNSQGNDGGSVMKPAGTIFMVLGLLWMFVAFNMETTVGSGFGEVHNLGLMEERRNHLYLAGGTMLIGVLLFGFGSVVQRGSGADHGSLRSCPICAEQIQRQAIKCRFCGADVSKEVNVRANFGDYATPSLKTDAEHENANNDVEKWKPIVSGNAALWIFCGIVALVFLAAILDIPLG
jgi:hypothetical protein